MKIRMSVRLHDFCSFLVLSLFFFLFKTNFRISFEEVEAD